MPHEMEPGESRPHELTIVCGNAGVGKTTFARRLAKEKGALLLDIDTVAERLVQAGLSAMGHDPDDRDSPRYKQIYRQPIHETLLAIARDNLEHVPCIIVAPFTRERRDPDFLTNCQRDMGTTVRVLYLVCDEKTRRERIIARGNPRDRLKLEEWESYSTSGQDPSPPPFAHELIDTSTQQESGSS